MTAVISGCFGGYDVLQTPANQTMHAEWICFTDQPMDAPPPWRVEVLRPDHPAMAYDHPRDKTVWCKTQPWKLTAHRNVIWVDANSIIVSSAFVDEAVRYARHGFATYAHPDRDCIYDEALAALSIHPAKYDSQPLLEQVNHYRTLGHPENAGLYAVGTCVYDTGRAEVRNLCNLWLAECERWSYQTQLSLPFVARVAGFQVGTFGHHQIVNNPWMRLGEHLRID